MKFKTVYKVNKEFFYNNSKELWYFLGFVSADGYISHERLIINLNVKDKHILESFTKIIQPTKKMYYAESTNSISFRIDNTEIAKRIKELLDLDLYSTRKTETLKFPKVPNEYIKDYILGYADGDGCITKCSGQRIFKKIGIKRYYRGMEFKILGTKEFLDVLKDKINLIYPNGTTSIRKKGNENVYILSYNFSTAKNILDELYKDKSIYLYRKYNKYLELKDTTHEDIVYSPNKYRENEGIQEKSNSWFFNYVCF